MEPILRAHAVAGDVIEDRVAEHRVQRFFHRNFPRAATDYHGQLRLRMRAAVVVVDANRLVMSDQARRWLQEERRMIRRSDLPLVARRVVHGHAADLARPAHWGRHVTS